MRDVFIWSGIVIFISVLMDFQRYMYERLVCLNGDRLAVKVIGFTENTWGSLQVCVQTDDDTEYEIAVPDSDLHLYRIGDSCSVYIYNERMVLKLI